ncbi:hypothetical protein ADL27_15775 [Streptomyces sp. NRRL F-6602]|nr:hypothetical protein ADL27_15775 [Streptomyces sp. NRRL F-6602]
MTGYQPRHASAPSQRGHEPEGCLTVAVRLPVRVVMFVLVLPVRLVWDGLVAAGRAFRRGVLGPVGRALSWLGRVLLVSPARWTWHRLVVPLGRGLAVVFRWTVTALFVWPWAALWRYVLLPVGRGAGWLGRGLAAAGAFLGRVLVVVPVTWVHTRLLVPLARAVGRGCGLLGRYLFVLPAVLLWRHVLAPAGRGTGLALAWLWRWLVAAPAAALHRYVLVPLGRAVVAAVRGTGAVLLLLGRYLLVVPLVALYRWVLAPAGRGLALVVREIAAAAAVAWRVTGRVTAFLLRGAGRVLYVLLVAPLIGLWRHVLAPFGRVLRGWVWQPVAAACRAAGRALRSAGYSVRSALRAARASVRSARAEIRRALFGVPRSREREPLP